MSLHGLDRAAAPTAHDAKEMLAEIGGTWWNVYIGGPRSLGSGWTPALLGQYRANGITRFLLIYVGRQKGGPLTTDQGVKDGEEACRLAGQFGFPAPGVPVCLDLEAGTFDAFPRTSLDYAVGWCRAVRRAGNRPGVYSNPAALRDLSTRPDKPDWVWIAHWVSHTVLPHADPHRGPGLAAELWSEPGERAWQYAGEFDKVPLRVGGLDVDISVADSGCLVGGTEEDDMGSYTDAERAEILRAARQVNGAVAFGQRDFAGTVEATLRTVQQLTTQVRQLGIDDDHRKVAVLGAIAASATHHLSEDEQRQLAARLVEALRAAGVAVTASEVLPAIRVGLQPAGAPVTP